MIPSETVCRRASTELGYTFGFSEFNRNFPLGCAKIPKAEIPQPQT